MSWESSNHSRPGPHQQELHRRRERRVAELETTLLVELKHDLGLRNLVVRTLRQRASENPLVASLPGLWTLRYESDVSVRARSVACGDEPTRSAAEAAAQLMQAGPEVLTPIAAMQFRSKYFSAQDNRHAASNITYLLEHEAAHAFRPDTDAGSQAQRAHAFRVLQARASHSDLLRHLVPPSPQ